MSCKRRLSKPWKRSIKLKVMNHCGKYLATPLHFAVHSSSSDTVEYLLENGADLNIKFRELTSPFYYAIKILDGSSRGYTTLESMLAHGADVKIVLREAMRSRDDRLLELAIKYNADLDLLIEQEWGGRTLTSLHQAVDAYMFDANRNTIGRLLEAGADPLVKDSDGRTALQYLQELCSFPFLVVQKQVEKKGEIESMFEEFGYSHA